MNLATRLVWLRRLGLVCVGMTVLLMGLGAWVKANGAGLSCPDWPACYGEWLPPFPSMESEGSTPGIQGPDADHAEAYTHAQVLYEWTHRLVASLLGAIVLAFAIVATRGKELAIPTRQLPAMAFALVIFQAGLGAITVRTGNPPWATTLHLVTAVVFLLVLTVAASYAFLRPLPIDAPVEAPKPRKIEYVYADAASQDPASDANE
ncbi:MAG: COX15/CtaA family protein [Candidatus Thermoplasmatota archaeon]